MPKVSTKKKQDTEPVFDNPSFPDIETDDGDIVTESSGNKGKKGSDDPQAALLASLQQQVAQLSSRTEELQRTNMALMASPVASNTGGGTSDAPKFDMTNLPDPSLEPERYAQEVAQRSSKFVSDLQAQNMRATNTRNQQENRVQSLWNEFETTYEDYADQEKIDFIAQKVVKGMQNRGVDPEKYMFGAKDTFFRDVITEYDKVFGKPGEKDDDDDAGTEDDKTPANRTGGIFGGLESGAGRSAGAEPQSDMLKEIQDRQRKSGFY